MKTKSYLLHVFILMTIAFSFTVFTGCSDDDDPSDPEISDPEGTVTVYINKDDYYGFIKWDTPNNIVTRTGDMLNGFALVDVGEVKGIGDINKVPEKGWTKTVACKPKHGYILQHAISYMTTYYRIYVVKNITNKSGEIIGAEIKEQNWYEERYDE